MGYVNVEPPDYVRHYWEWTRRLLGAEPPEWLKWFGRLDGEEIIERVSRLGLKGEPLEELKVALYGVPKSREEVGELYQKIHELLCPPRLRQRIDQHEEERDRRFEPLAWRNQIEWLKRLLRSEVRFVETLTFEERERYLLTKEILVELQKRLCESLSMREFEEMPKTWNWRCRISTEHHLEKVDASTGEEVPTTPFVKFYQRWDGKLFMRRSHPEDHSIVTCVKNRFYPEKWGVASLNKHKFLVDVLQLKERVKKEFKDVFTEFGLK